jgi:hypothetical protein
VTTDELKHRNEMAAYAFAIATHDINAAGAILDRMMTEVLESNKVADAVLDDLEREDRDRPDRFETF